MGKITFVPVGGLANRMRAVASAVMLAGKTKSELSIIWFRDWALNAPFYQLFKPVDREVACLRDASRLDYALLDRPRSKNFHFPLLFQKLLFKSCLYERSITPLCNRHFDFERWVKEGGCVYMASYTAFQLYDYAWISRLFVPVDEIMEEVENRCRNFSDAMIGVHIRRTDNLASIRQSPIELFYQKLDEKIKEDGKVAIYLATDSEEVKREMKERYGDRIFCSGKRQTVDLWRNKGGYHGYVHIGSYTKNIWFFSEFIFGYGSSDRRGSIGDFEIMSYGNKSLF